ncbi:dihydroorotate dehydrogenase (quinone) [Helicobacter trogontum]|uniref:dihydroorotate dehydrogenase (quinone) n=1 Tax=Helicobacter trogontum TaxID=50960 RepID=UPI000CF1B96A|nr:dihydroorotate dehydrogenase (quinone) [Helicobacter trogontum]
MGLYKKIRPYLYKCDAEKIHNLTVKAMKLPQRIPLFESMIAKYYCRIHESLAQDIHGLHFYNPIGLASGFDKNAEIVRPLASLGFGYLELGSVTQMPQEGNEKPRMFRHVEEESLQNAMGFNNIGARGMLAHLKEVYPFCIPLGINIGKNKNIAQGDSLKNYELSLDTLKDYGDYFAFNLSSPNTPGLRDLQNESFVADLINMAKGVTNKPIFIKISPDMEIDSMLTVCDSAIKHGVSGIIATNTSIDYTLVSHPAKRNEQCFGGISGKALTSHSREILKILGQNFHKKTTLISVGGICDSNEVYERIKLGANLVQILSSMVYEGPTIIARMNNELAEKLKADGFNHINDAIGVAVQ